MRRNLTILFKINSIKKYKKSVKAEDGFRFDKAMSSRFLMSKVAVPNCISILFFG